jgi:hypothetical protein
MMMKQAVFLSQCTTAPKCTREELVDPTEGKRERLARSGSNKKK